MPKINIMKQNNIKEIIEQFNAKNTINDRYCSFDYCYNYFHPSNRSKIGDIEKSCLVLGFYLASWGMLRGSSFLLKRSIKCYTSTVKYILEECDNSDWDIDVPNYNDERIKRIEDIYGEIRQRLIRDKTTTHKTLVTKVLLGVFGFIPAFDNNFITTFKQITNNECGFSVVNSTSLGYIKKFYDDNKTEIDNIKIFTKDFSTEKETKLRYSKAKIIDMYGFQKYISNGN